jgi:hypothetical protein
MANVYIYRVTANPGTEGYVRWTECEGYEGPAQYVTIRGGSIDFEAVENSVIYPAGMTVDIVGVGSSQPNCIGDGYYNGVPTTTTTTIPLVNFTITPTCGASGLAGDGIVTVSSFNGGVGSYQSVAIGTTSGYSYYASPTNLSGATTSIGYMPTMP